jgi:hypothetical protein
MNDGVPGFFQQEKKADSGVLFSDWGPGNEWLARRRGNTQYFPKPPVMGVIPESPECSIKWD